MFHIRTREKKSIKGKKKKYEDVLEKDQFGK